MKAGVDSCTDTNLKFRRNNDINGNNNNYNVNNDTNIIIYTNTLIPILYYISGELIWVNTDTITLFSLYCTVCIGELI